MDQTRRSALTGIQQLERELIVRDFITVLNTGATAELHPFLCEDVVYRTGHRACVRGRSAVVAMIGEIRSAFDEWQTSALDIAVTGDVVLAEQAVKFTLTGGPSQWLLGLASFRLDGARISTWSQLHG